MRANSKTLPNHWDVIKLGSYVEKEKGKKPRNQSASQSGAYVLPYIDIEAFEQGIIKSWTDGKGCRICKASDLLMVWDGSRSGLVGRGMDGALGSTLMRINFPNINNQYAFYFLLSKYQEINTRAKGSGTPHVDPDLLWNYDFPIPPSDEQTLIVAKIEELFSELDSGVASLKTAQEQLKIYRQALLKHAFEGKLTEQWRKDNPPSQWETTRLDNLLGHVTSGSRGWAKYYSDDGDLFVRAQNLKNDQLELNDVAYVALPENIEGKRTEIKVGDVLITITGANVTKAGYVKQNIGQAYVNQHVALCRPNGLILTKYLYYFLISDVKGRRQLEKFAYGAGKPGLNLSNIRDVIIDLPDKAEQQEIVNQLEEKLSIIEQNEKEIESALAKAELLRQSILKKAFSGQLVS